MKVYGIVAASSGVVAASMGAVMMIIVNVESTTLLDFITSRDLRFLRKGGILTALGGNLLH